MGYWKDRLERAAVEVRQTVTRANEDARSFHDPDGAVRGALDCDLGRSPLTNLMPARRHHLHEHPGAAQFLMAWVSVPDLGCIRPASATSTYDAARAKPSWRTMRCRRSP